MMKNAAILHGTDFNKTKKQKNNNWFPWLKKELKKEGYKVLLEELPKAWEPDIDNYWEFLQDNFEINNDSIIVGHSSGAAAIPGILNRLPNGVRIDKAVLVAGFIKDRGWNCEGLFKDEFDWEKIRSKANNFVVFHSDDDPYCPLEDAEEIAKKLDTKVILKKGQKHFSVSTAGKRYKKFPELLEYL